MEIFKKIKDFFKKALQGEKQGAGVWTTLPASGYTQPSEIRPELLYQKAGEGWVWACIKAIAEEFRGFAVENDLPIWSATQVNRAGFGSSDISLEDTSESFGLPATADFMIALISNEDLEELGQLMIKQLKSRYNDINYYKKFVIGIDKSKMRLFNLDDEEQTLVDSGHKEKTDYSDFKM